VTRAVTGVEQAVAEAPDVSLPLALVPQINAQALQLMQPTFWWLHVMGRLKPGVSAAQAQADLAPVFQHTARAGFDAHMSSSSGTMVRPRWA
jgi:hypothetical protein